MSHIACMWNDMCKPIIVQEYAFRCNIDSDSDFSSLRTLLY